MRNCHRILLFTGIFILFFALLTGPALFAAGQKILPAAAATVAATQQPIVLPEPQKTGGMPLMEALNHRKTTRTFADKPIPVQTLSSLLWAADGVNRPTLGMTGPGRPNSEGHTAPSNRNNQDIQLYVLLAQGTYVYDSVKNVLNPVVPTDLRTRIGYGTNLGTAHSAVTIIFVTTKTDDPYAGEEIGFVGQNIYLYAASEGLNAWFFTLHNQDTAALNLGPDKAAIGFGESVGYPDK